MLSTASTSSARISEAHSALPVFYTLQLGLLDGCSALRKEHVTTLRNKLLTSTCDRQGAQGKLDRASKAELENEFGTSRDDDVVQQILEKGNLQETKGHGKQGDRNVMNGPMIGTATEVHN